MKRKLLSTAVAASVVMSTQAYAQLEEVLVTAQKRAQSAQEIGITMTTMSSEDLQNLGVFEASEITEFVPNMEISNSADSDIPIFVVRGVGLQDYNTNNTPTTAVVVDDVYQPFGVYTAFAMFDTERVEILKGPQGGLYGRNSTGGAINIISRKGNFETIEADAALDIGNYGLVNFRGGVSLPFNDKLAMRFAVQRDTSDGLYYNTYLNRDQGGKDKLQSRLTLSFLPTETFSADLRLTYGRDESETTIPELEGILDPNSSFGPTGLTTGTTPLPPILGPSPSALCPSVIATGVPDATCVTMTGATPDGHFTGREAFVRNNDDTYKSASLNLNFDFGSVSLDSITNFTKLEFFHQNGSGSQGLGVDEVNRATWEQVAAETGRTINFEDTYVTEYNSDIDSWSQELRLSSNNDEGMTWMVGATYAEDDLDEQRRCTFGAILYADWLAFPGCGHMPFTQETKVSSIYGQLIFELSDTLTLTADARYTREKKDYVGSVMVNDGAWAAYAWGIVPDFATGQAVFADGPIPLASGTPATYDEKEPSWKVNLDWHPNDDTLVYLSAGRTFKSGGFFGGFFFQASAVEAYAPETNTAIELGFKSTLASGNVQLNGAIFSYKYKDFQSPLEIKDGNATFSGLTNMGDVDTYGAELDLHWLPVEGLDIRAGLGYLDTEIVRGPSGTGSIYNIRGEEVDVVGNELNYSPKWSANLLARYDTDLNANLNGAVQLGVNWQDDYFLGITNEPYLAEKGRALVNARAEVYQSSDRGWKVAVWVKNLTDEEYRTTTLDDGLQSYYSYWGTPRTYGVTLSYDY